LRNTLVFSILATLKKKTNQSHLSMDAPCNLYKSQYKKAKETLDILMSHRAEIELKLESDPISPDFHKELRTVNLEIRITQNELEQAESDIKECELQYSLPKT